MISLSDSGPGGNRVIPILFLLTKCKLSPVLTAKLTVSSPGPTQPILSIDLLKNSDIYKANRENYSYREKQYTHLDKTEVLFNIKSKLPLYTFSMPLFCFYTLDECLLCTRPCLRYCPREYKRKLSSFTF